MPHNLILHTLTPHQYNSWQPHSLLDSPATFSIANPNNTFTLDNQIPSLANSPQDIANSHTTQHKEAITKDTHNLTTLSNPPHQAPSTKKHYTCIITALQYLGVQNANHSLEGTTAIAYKHFFSFTLTSVLKRLDYNKANRIYTHTNIIDVIKTTLNFYTGRMHKEVDFSHLHSFYDTKELITQYNESDLAFITRIAHNNGIYFYEDEHTIYFCDAYKQTLPTTIPYNPNLNNTLNELYIHSFVKQDTIVPNSFSQSSINAAYLLYAQSLHHHIDSAPILYNQHEYRAQTSFNLQDNAQTPLQLQEKHYALSKESIIAKGDVYHLALGESMTITSAHSVLPTATTSQDTNNQYVIIAIEQTLIDTASLANTTHTPSNTTLNNTTATNPPHNTTPPNHTHNTTIVHTNTTHTNNPLFASSLHSSDSLTPTSLSHTHTLIDRYSNPTNITSAHSTIATTATTNSPFIRSYSNTLTILPNSVAFTPSPKSKPLPPTSTQGIVIGQSSNIQEESNTIYTDEYGRVRVRIHCFANQEEIDNALYATHSHKAHNQSLDSHITSNPPPPHHQEHIEILLPHLTLQIPLPILLLHKLKI